MACWQLVWQHRVPSEHNKINQRLASPSACLEILMNRLPRPHRTAAIPFSHPPPPHSSVVKPAPVDSWTRRQWASGLGAVTWRKWGAPSRESWAWRPATCPAPFGRRPAPPTTGRLWSLSARSASACSPPPFSSSALGTFWTRSIATKQLWLWDTARLETGKANRTTVRLLSRTDG